MHRNIALRGLLIILTMAVSSQLCLVSATAQDNAQTRTSGTRVSVPIEKINVDDGDTVTIDWSDTDTEIVRILGIDTPETQHVDHNIPFDQSFGREAAGFAKGAFAAATEVELLRASMMDRYGRTLGYLFVNGQNYSVLVIRARLAVETVSHYGDNGLPEESAACLAAAADAGPAPFEPPYKYRGRMREVSTWMREQGLLPPAAD